MATESVVFIVTFGLALAGIAFAVLHLSTKARLQDRMSDAVVKAHASQQNTPEAQQHADDVSIVNAKASALGGIEADEAAGRSPRMTGSWVAAHRRNVRREISMRRARIRRQAADSARRGPVSEI